MQIRERLLEFIHGLGIDSVEFAKHVGVNSTTMHHIISDKGRKNKPSLETINKILDKYPELSRDWLEKGVEPKFTLKSGPAIEDQQIELHPLYRKLEKKYLIVLEKLNDLKK